MLQAKWFEAASSLVGRLTSMLDVTSHHDLVDFGLAPPAQDAADLSTLHATLVSQDWRQIRELAGQPTQIAVLDYKGRLLYTSAAPHTWRGHLGDMPAIANVLGGQADESFSVVGYDEPAFVAAGLFGAHPAHGLAVMFVRALAGGGAFLQFIDARDVLAGIRLDATRLGLIALDGRSAGDVPAALARAAPSGGRVGNVAVEGTTFEVQARPLRDPAGRPYARVVMARPEPGVLALFEHSRVVFAAAALAGLGIALGAMLRARRISSARR